MTRLRPGGWRLLATAVLLYLGNVSDGGVIEILGRSTVFVQGGDACVHPHPLMQPGPNPHNPCRLTAAHGPASFFVLHID